MPRLVLDLFWISLAWFTLLHNQLFALSEFINLFSGCFSFVKLLLHNITIAYHIRTSSNIWNKPTGKLGYIRSRNFSFIFFRVKLNPRHVWSRDFIVHLPLKAAAYRLPQYSTQRICVTIDGAVFYLRVWVYICWTAWLMSIRVICNHRSYIEILRGWASTRNL